MTSDPQQLLDPIPSHRKGPMARRSFTGVLWMFGGGASEAIARIVVLAILARLVSPAEFGLIGAATTVVLLAEIFGQIGVAPSLVQTATLTRRRIGTAITATLVLSIVVAVGVWLLAGPIAAFYKMPQLVPFVQAFAGLFLLKGAGLVPESLLQRDLAFRTMALVRLISYVLGFGGIAVFLASRGAGAWALAWGQIAQAIVQTGLFAFLSRRHLGLAFHAGDLREMLEFGFGVTLSRLGNYVAMNGDYFVVGRFLGAELLGFYTRAYFLLMQPAQIVGRAGDQVLFPALSAIQEDRDRVRRGMDRAIAVCAAVQIPATAFLIVLAPEIVLVLLGEDWTQAILPFRILVVTLFFRTAYKFFTSAFRATGAVYLNAAWQWSYALLVVLGALAGQPFGLPGVAWGVGGAVVICYAAGAFLSWRLGLLSASGQRALVGQFLVGVAAGFAVWGTNLFLVQQGVQDILRLVFLSAGAVGLYGAVILACPAALGSGGADLRNLALKRTGRGRGKG